MNLLDTLRGLARRWYIVVPGLVLAIGAALGAWTIVQPEYERTATVLLLPGTGTLPKDASNPYLYLGGLTAVADVVVRAIGSEDALRDVLEPYPGAKVEVARDASTAGPVIVITVTAKGDADAEALVAAVLDSATSALDELQTRESIAPKDRVTVTPISVDGVSIPVQRNRVLVSGGLGVGVVLLTLIAASLIDGLATRAPRRVIETDPSTDSDASEIGDDDDQTQPVDVEPPQSPRPKPSKPKSVVRRQLIDDPIGQRDG